MTKIMNKLIKKPKLDHNRSLIHKRSNSAY